MSTWPTAAILRFSGLSEDFDPSVERTEMERGVPRQRVINSGVMATVTATVLFKTPEDVAVFEAWYFNDIKRIGWFDVVHPRTGQVVVARFVGGKLGAMSPQAPRFHLAQREVVMEYLR